MCIKDKTTKEERQAKCPKMDRKYNRMIKKLAYKNEGVLFLKALENACGERMARPENYQVDFA